MFLIILLAVSSFAFGQSLNTNAYHLLIPSIGFDSVKIGHTSKKDIIRLYGDNYKIDTNYASCIDCVDWEDTITPHKLRVYSISMSYKSLGIEFNFFPGKEAIFAVTISSPFKGRTEKGIVLNESTFKDIEKIYGKTEWYFAGSDMMKEYTGITFYCAFEGKLPISDEKLIPYLNKKVAAISISVEDN